MTSSTHVYTAHALTGANITGPEVDLQGGNVSLDAGRTPHVQGSIVVTLDDALAALDPRDDARVKVDVAATFPDRIQARAFNLGIRDRQVSLVDGTVRLELASDEALLVDYIALADDSHPFTIAASLRAVINYVLSVALPGATLAASPATDANMTPYWELTNRVFNPAAETTVGYSLGLNAKGLGNGTGGVIGSKFVWWQSNAAGWTYVIADGDRRCSPGDVLTGAVWITASLSSLLGYAILRFFDSSGNIMVDIPGTGVAAGTTWPRATVTAATPPGAASVLLVLGFQATAASQTLGGDGFQLIDGPYVQPYWDGSTPDDAHYLYDWEGPAYASPSTRTPLVESDPDALVWRTGQSALDFLHPLYQSRGLRLVCDESRVWTLRDEGYLAPGSITIRQGVNMVAAQESVSRDSEDWFDAAVTTYAWLDRNGNSQRRQDAYAEPGATRGVAFERLTPYPGAGFSEYAVRRALQRGRELTATAVANWTAQTEQPVSIYVTGEDTQTGGVQAVNFDFDRDEMDVTARTTDTPAGAWILGPDTKKWAGTNPTMTWNTFNWGTA